MSAPESVADAKGTIYKLGKKIGSGGQGAVFEVQGGRFAVKLLRNAGQRGREQLRNRLAYVRRLPIDGLPLAKPLEVLRLPQTGYVMERMTGMVPIKSLMVPTDKRPPDSRWYGETGGLRRRLLALGRAAQVLAQLHGKGLAYADPSPGNILVSSDPSYNEVWFIDADNLCHVSTPLAARGVFTPGYGAPELVAGRSGVSTLTDAYAFAVVAFQVLALVHPFVGDRVDGGEPELEEQAFAGELPWVDDGDDDSNRTKCGVPREHVLSNGLRELYQQAFGSGRKRPMERPGMALWAERLYAAADATIKCQGCGATYYRNFSQCPWCGVARPSVVMATFHIWDPNLKDGPDLLTYPVGNVKKRVIVARRVLTAGDSFVITRRRAFDDDSARANEALVEVKFGGQSVHVRNRGSTSCRLVSPDGEEDVLLGTQTQRLRVDLGRESWQLHFGPPDSLHRVVRFSVSKGDRK